jgi:hypothetical protein
MEHVARGMTSISLSLMEYTPVPADSPVSSHARKHSVPAEWAYREAEARIDWNYIFLLLVMRIIPLSSQWQSCARLNFLVSANKLSSMSPSIMNGFLGAHQLLIISREPNYDRHLTAEFMV